MKKILILALAVSAFTVIGLVSSQQICHVTASRSPMSGLGLSSAQKAKINEIESRYAFSENAICMEVCRKRADLVRMLARKDSVDAEVTALIDSIGKLDADLEKEIATHVLEIKRNLDAAQADKYIRKMSSQMHCPVKMKSDNR